MIGIRIELAKNSVQIHTAHLKKLSTNSKDTVRIQFEEIRAQFKNAALCNEGMILACDANVHVGDSIPLCKDKQDWAGAQEGNLWKY